MKIYLLQMCSGLDASSNIDFIKKQLDANRPAPGSWVFLPECFLSISDGKSVTPFHVDANEKQLDPIKSLAKDFQVYLLGGSAITKVGERFLNRCYNFSPEGKIIGTYDKMHLFCYQQDPQKKDLVIDETRFYQPGDKLQKIVINEIQIGLSICFDLRFAEMYRKYNLLGVDILSVSSAFTYNTGKDHWEILLRARAIENQAYVIACNQVGQHNANMRSFGHSMIVDPWGKVLVNMQETQGLGICEIDLSLLNTVRARMDMHRSRFL